MCASAPSHRYHAMPPRTTEQSHRPRVSDRTVWLPRQPCSLAQLQSPNGIDTRAHETPWNTPRSTLSVGNTKGWMSRTSSSPVSGRKMSLDIPFHRTSYAPNGITRPVPGTRRETGARGLHVPDPTDPPRSPSKRLPNRRMAEEQFGSGCFHQHPLGGAMAVIKHFVQCAAHE